MADADKFQAFEEWLRSTKTQISKLELKDYGNEVRGCHATEALSDDEIIIEVPLKCLITVEMGKDTDIGRQIISSNIELDAPKHIFLMVFMLVDRQNPDSFFKPYYDILPKTLNNMPIFWTEDELKWLTGSHLLEQVEQRTATIAADYKAICDIAPEFASICNLHEFMWARMCVCSRNFGMVINGVQTAALVPYADMLNHYRPRETKWQFDDSLQAFTVVALQTIEAGAQVYDSYGRKCNHRFLLNYGFSVENNVEMDGSNPNEVPVHLEMNPEEELYDLKLAYFRRDLAHMPYRNIRVSVSENDNTKLMLSFLRIIVADKEDFDRLTSPMMGLSSIPSIRDAQVAISVSNELRAMQYLRDLCDTYLSRYPTTYESDVERLKSDDSLVLYSNERHAVIQVRGEKEVLLFFRDFAESGIKLLQAPDMDAFDVLLEEIRLSKDVIIFYYCRSVCGRLLHENRRRAERNIRSYDLARPTVV